MYKNRAKDGANNISGRRIQAYRKRLPGSISQNKFAAMLQVRGLDIDKNAVQRIECGKRFVTDIELKVIAETLGVTCDALLTEN
ncbi:MAG: helix-turn-helix transcriptional regulator [Clostridia bacterium]|nr:helix-turn-helix transcriptional regulator [Clostridia bacterium]